MYYRNEDLEFNRYINLDTVERRILEGLIKSRTVHAMRLWDMLAIEDINCLNRPLSQELLSDLNDKRWNDEFDRRSALVYDDEGEFNGRKVFLSPFIDDAETKATIRLDIFVDDIIPKNHIMSTVLVGAEIIVHNKLVNIRTDASEDNPHTNPTDLKRVVIYDKDINEEIEMKYPISDLKSRSTSMLKALLSELNGVEVAGVGQLQLNSTMSPKVGVKRLMWDHRKYLGYGITFATLMSEASANPEVAY